MQQWIDGWVSNFARASTKRNRSNLEHTLKLSKVRRAISPTFAFLLYFLPFMFVFRNQSIITISICRFTCAGRNPFADFFNVSFLFSSLVFRGA